MRKAELELRLEEYGGDFKDFLNLLLERGKEGEREEEKHQCVVASHAPPTGDLACNPGMCLDWNRTGDPLVLRLALNPLSHISQGLVGILMGSYKVFQAEETNRRGQVNAWCVWS